jgi:hypothetical protein
MRKITLLSGLMPENHMIIVTLVAIQLLFQTTFIIVS